MLHCSIFVSLFIGAPLVHKLGALRRKDILPWALPLFESSQANHTLCMRGSYQSKELHNLRKANSRYNTCGQYITDKPPIRRTVPNAPDRPFLRHLSPSLHGHLLLVRVTLIIHFIICRRVNVCVYIVDVHKLLCTRSEDRFVSVVV